MDPGIEPTAMSSKDWDKLDRKVTRTIFLCLSDSILLNASGENSAKKQWENLGNLY